MRWKRTGEVTRPARLSTEERFWSHVEKTDDCWLWRGSRLPDGYGHFTPESYKSARAHRFSYELAHGSIPVGFHVLHACDTPPCVNPDHLFLGTHAENMADSAAKSRQGHPGESNGRALLSTGEVRAIRARHMAGESPRRIASAFGVAVPTVRDILKRRTWQHI